MKTITKGKKVVRNTLLIGGILLGSLLYIDEAKANNEKGEVPTPPNSELIGEFVTLKLNLEQIEYIGKIQQEKARQKVIQAREEAWEKARLRQVELKRIEEERLAKIREEERQRKLAEERQLAEIKKQEEIKKAQQQKKQQESVKVQSGGKTFNVKATFYTSKCKGCSGITAMGINVRNTIYYKGMRVIAVDPRYIPLGSIVRVDMKGQSFAIAGDKGGAIKGANRIDVLVKTKAEAYRLGIQKNVKVTVLKRS